MRRLILFVAALPVAASAADVRMGVLEFQAAGATPSFASTVAGMVANELSRLGTFQVTSAEAVHELLAHERNRAILGGCDSDTCAAGLPALSAMIGVDYLVSGKVSRVAGGRDMPASVTLELSLLNVKKGSREASDIQLGQTEAELIGKIRKSVIKLVGKILAGRQGTLLLAASESGATVKVDDATVGTTPLDAQVPLAAGPHFVQVDKQGFVSAQREVKIQADQALEERFTLAPSPDFVRDYESSQGKVRLAAWVTSGLAVAGAATFGIFQYRATKLYGSPDSPNSFQYHRDRLLAGIEVEDGVDHRAAVVTLSQQISTAQNVSYIGAGVGGAALIAAGYFWLWGEDPKRYSKFKDVVVTPAPGGGHVSLSLEW